MIQQLSPELIRLIAAGEVIQHPTSIAKELIENALDAQATQISISADQAGYARLSVTDNGHGMSEEDLALAWQPHTTSKLRNLDDLQAINSFGFRGEALHSMATMARLTIRSRTELDTTAHQVTLEQGKVTIPIQPAAGTTGTHIVVEELFAGVPGRRRPRTTRTETKELVQLVTAYALIFPEVGWSLQIDDLHLRWLAQQTHTERIQNFWGETSQESNWPVVADVPNGKVHGFLGHPRQARRQMRSVVSINGRWVVWPALNDAVKLAFGTLLEAQMNPSWVLHFQLDPTQIDPNIHPNKREVQIYNEPEILRTLIPQLQQSLETHFLATQREVLWRVAESSPDQNIGKFLKRTTELATLENPATEIAQLNRLFLVTQTSEGMLLIDQHAAHERVLYEQFLTAWNNSTSDSQELTPALTIHVSPSDELELRHHLDMLEGLGWNLEPFGEQRWAIRAVPKLLADRDPASLLRGVIDDLDSDLLPTTLHPHHHRLLATLACRSAIKAGQELSNTARRELLKQLSETKTTATCPHGRPVSVLIPWIKVEEWFHR